MDVVVIDVGNSFTKVALTQEAGTARVRELPTGRATPEAVAALLPELRRGGPVHAIVGNVAAKECGDAAAAAVRRRYGAEPYRLAPCTRFPFAFAPGIDPAAVGEDLKALAAFCAARGPRAAGFSFGTASAAVLVADGALLGAAVAPGISMGVDAVCARTAGAGSALGVQVHGRTVIGLNARDALAAGAFHMRAGFVASFVREGAKALGAAAADLPAFVCGHDAQDVPGAVLANDAVVRGYRLIYLHNLP